MKILLVLSVLLLAGIAQANKAECLSNARVIYNFQQSQQAALLEAGGDLENMAEMQKNILQEQMEMLKLTTRNVELECNTKYPEEMHRVMMQVLPKEKVDFNQQAEKLKALIDQSVEAQQGKAGDGDNGAQTEDAAKSIRTFKGVKKKRVRVGR